LSRRRASTSAIEELAEPFQNLPAPIGVGVAVSAGVAGWVISHLQGTSPIGAVVLALAPWLLWLFGAMVLAYAFGGAVRRTIDRRRFDTTVNVRDLDPYQFESYVGEYYRRRGWRVNPRGGRSADGGVDLVLEEGTRRVLVQCKHWKAWTVGVRPIRELVGIVGHERATGAILVTSGRFTAEARSFAAGKELELVDGQRLRELIAEVREPGGRTNAGAAVASRTGPTCPKCRAQMVIRTSRRGPHAGSQFWGCSRYPACSHVIHISAA
jgi:restriction system protein